MHQRARTRSDLAMTKGKHLLTFVVAFTLSEFQSPHSFSSEIKAGQAEYENKCAACHGKDGSGNGPVAPALRRQPPDLRLLTRNNRGVYPAEVLRGIVDGRRSLRAHGNYEMPVWGRETSPGGTDISTNERIAAIVEYLRSMQIK
ncbi:cytochrome c (plasmid) [Bosea sp. F3-2]|nr:cytochrome c [Bosea sp. F3-2]